MASTICAFALLLGGMMLVAQPAAAQSFACKTDPNITCVARLGTSNAVRKPIADLAELKRFAAAEGKATFATILRMSGWNAEQIAAFEKAVQEIDDTPVTLERGQQMKWMAIRKNGEPTLISNPQWIGKKTETAWLVAVEPDPMKGGKRFELLIPKACGNLALANVVDVAAPPAAPAPSTACTIRVMRDEAGCDAGTAVVDTTGSNGLAKVLLVGDGSPIELDAKVGKQTASGLNREAYTAKAMTTDGKSCEASLAACPKPSCAIDLTYDDATRMLAIRATGKPSAPTTAELTAPNGKTSTISLPWEGKVKKGDYSVKATTADGASCDASLLVDRAAVEGGRWIGRLFLASIGVEGDKYSTSTFRPNGVNQRDQLNIGSGVGLGIAAEYLFRPKHGIELGLIAGNIDATFIRDLDELWGMDDDDLSLLMPSIGYNYHFRPDEKADVYFGPALALVDVGSASFNVLDERVKRSFDSDLALGLQLGVDWWLSGDRSWGLHTGARYFDLQIEDDAGEELELDVNPLMLTVGVSHRF